MICSIVKDVPLRPGTYEHKFTASIAVKNKEQDNKNNKLENKNTNIKRKGIGINQKYDPFQELLDVSKKNENNIKKIINK